jgi:hypothetical protein
MRCVVWLSCDTSSYEHLSLQLSKKRLRTTHDTSSTCVTSRIVRHNLQGTKHHSAQAGSLFIASPSIFLYSCQQLLAIRTVRVSTSRSRKQNVPHNGIDLDYRNREGACYDGEQLGDTER